jgi:hypothetical protein
MDSFIAVLLALKRCVAPPGYDPAAAAGAEAAPKCAGLGLVQPPAAAVTAAVSGYGGNSTSGFAVRLS